VRVDLTELVEEERDPLAEDDALVARLRAGDREALGQLFLRHANPVRRLLVSVMGPSDEVEDLVQDVFLGVHRSIAGFRGTARFSTWLHRIAVNTALSALRRPRRAVAVEPEDLDRHSDRASGVDTAVLVRERVRRLYAILDAMTPKRRRTRIPRRSSSR
jgi:RNA polymerase sigma-70 factor (ECF subfamily)